MLKTRFYLKILIRILELSEVYPEVLNYLSDGVRRNSLPFGSEPIDRCVKSCHKFSKI
jgi:hypothetical protein